MDKVEIRIDATDWAEQALRAELEIQGDEDVIKMADEGYTTGQMACILVGGRALGIVPAHTLKSDKLLLYGGARAEVATKYAACKRQAELVNGKTIEVREYVGPPGREDDNEDDTPKTFVRSETDEGMRLAERYLARTVPGHVYGHLKIIAANGGDVMAAAEALASKVLSMAEERVLEPVLA